MGNTFGNLFRLTTFGESHGKYIGGVIDDVLLILKLILNLSKISLIEESLVNLKLLHKEMRMIK